MTAYTAGMFDFFGAATPPIAVPIPRAIFLFFPVVNGLFGIVRHKAMQMKKGSIRAFFCACDKVNITSEPLVRFQH